MKLWSDGVRRRNAAVATLLLSALGAYYAYLTLGLDIGWRQCVANPVARNGDTLVFPLWEVTGIQDENHFLISKVVKDVPIEGPSAALAEGNTVSLIGHFNKDKMVVEQEIIEIHRLRPWKEALGAFGFVACVVLAPLCFRWRNARLIERGNG